jgi:hypothetical protein
MLRQGVRRLHTTARAAAVATGNTGGGRSAEEKFAESSPASVWAFRLVAVGASLAMGASVVPKATEMAVPHAVRLARADEGMFARSGARRIAAAARRGSARCDELVVAGALPALRHSALHVRRDVPDEVRKTRDAVFDALADMIDNSETVRDLVRTDTVFVDAILEAEATRSALRLRDLLADPADQIAASEQIEVGKQTS